MKDSIRILPYLSEVWGKEKIAFLWHRQAETCALHGHDCYEMELILSGHASQCLNGTSISLDPGTLYLLTPSDIHRVDVDEPLELICVKFMPELVSAMGLPALNEALAVQLPQDTFHMFTQLLHNALGTDDASVTQAGRMGAALIMIDHLLRYGTHYHPASWGKYIPAALQFIQQNYANPDLRLNDAAAICGLSACHFSKVFHQTVGQSFSHYLMDYRLHRVCALLSEPETSITEAAYMVGFSCLPHFFRIFRRYLGCTPGEYQQQHLQKTSQS